MKKILTGYQARAALMRGANFAGDLAGRTLGPKGRNAMIGDRFTDPMITNDGYWILKESIDGIADEFESMGARAILEASKKTNDKAGDNTTTSAVVAHQLVTDAFNAIDRKFDGVVSAKVDVMQIKRDIEKDCAIVCEKIDKVAVKLKKGQLAKVGEVSMENAEYGKLVAEVVTEVGVDGTINVEESDVDGVTVDYKNGLEIPRGIATKHLGNREDGGATVQTAEILITTHEIRTADQTRPLFDKLVATGQKQLIIIAPFFEPSLLAQYVLSKMQNTFHVFPVKFEESFQMDMIEDLAAKTGARVVDKTREKLEDIDIDALGACDKAVLTDGTSTFIGSQGNPDAQIKYLKGKRKEADSDFDKKRFDDRIAMLKGKVATIKVGASTHQARTYLKLKFDDAVCACKLAVEEGVVRGGGLCLFEIATHIPTSLLFNALQAPHKKIVENGCLTIPDDIIDPAKSVKIALQNACSIASVLLTTEILIVEANPQQ